MVQNEWQTTGFVSLDSLSSFVEQEYRKGMITKPGFTKCQCQLGGLLLDGLDSLLSGRSNRQCPYRPCVFSFIWLRVGHKERKIPTMFRFIHSMNTDWP